MKPILITDEMVRSTLDGRKTQTRRLVKPQPELRASRISFSFRRGKSFCDLPYPIPSDSTLCRHSSDCPFGQVGDRLWVRETWRVSSDYDSDRVSELPNELSVEYYADKKAEYLLGKKRPARFMPRWASRITLEITDIRIERLQEITEEEARAEGFFAHDVMSAVYWFYEAWDSLYARKGIRWNDNPWVWVITFRRVEVE